MMYCNACGKKLKMQHDVLLEDAFEAKKQWGFFSKKDMILHSYKNIGVCESAEMIGAAG